MFLGNPKDSDREDWGTLGNIREDQGNHHLLKNPTKTISRILGDFFTHKYPQGMGTLVGVHLTIL